ncbi:hypothetical protein B0H13DRAFT_2263461 [Mycena leptocephala]|nr:hypothetical protein B0H13DRAFT_2263461 [Mycena leptocephala]
MKVGHHVFRFFHVHTRDCKVISLLTQQQRLNSEWVSFTYTSPKLLKGLCEDAIGISDRSGAVVAAAVAFLCFLWFWNKTTAVHQNKILNAGPSSSRSHSNSNNHPHENDHGPRNNHPTASPIASPTLALPANVRARKYFSNLTPQNKSMTTRKKARRAYEVIIEKKTSLFVCAIGVPPKHAVDWLHQAGIPVGRPEYTNCYPHLRSPQIMNMVGHPKHVPKALEAGVDLICAQAGEGGHTGDIPSSILIPAAGAVYDGRGFAANFMWGAEAGWSAPASPPSRRTRRKSASCSAGFEDAVTTLIFTGRTPYIEDWNLNCQAEIEELTGKGKLPHEAELEKHPEISLETCPWLMGCVSAFINDVLPTQVIVDNMVRDAAVQLPRGDKYFNPKARL